MKRHILLFSLSLFFFSSFSQAPKWKDYSTAFGVNAIAFEGNYVWVATWGGLVRIDRITGNRTFYNGSNSGIQTNVISELLIDKNGNKWMAIGSGLAKFDGNNFSIYSYTPAGDTLGTASNLKLDKNGNIWFMYNSGYTSRGIAKFDGANWSILHYDTIPGPPCCGGPTSFDIDTLGNIWLATPDLGIMKFDGSIWTTYDTLNSLLNSETIGIIKVDNNNVLWTTTINWDTNHLFSFDGNTWTMYDTIFANNIADSSANIYIDRFNNKWFYGYLNEVYKFDGTNWQQYSISNKGIADLYPTCIEVDSLNHIWTGYFVPSDSLLYEYDGNAGKLYNVSFCPSGTDYTESVVIDSNNNKIIAYDDYLWKFDGINWQNITPPDNIGDSQFWELLIDHRGYLWAACASGTSFKHDMAYFNGVGWTVFPFYNCYYVREDSKGNIWFQGWDSTKISQYLCKFDGNQLISFKINSVTQNRLAQITIDSHDNIWISDYYNVARFDTSNQWTIFNNLGVNLGFIDADKEGNVWVENDSGLNKYDGNTWTLYNYSNSNWPQWGGMWRIKEDDHNNKWFCTVTAGLGKFDGQHFSFYNTSNSGICSNDVRDVAFDKYGNMWLAVFEGGLVCFNDSGIVDPTTAVKEFVNANSLKFFPNPLTDYSRIVFPNEKNEKYILSVFDLTGRMIKQTSTNSSEIIINKEKLIDGLYLYELRNASGDITYHGKFVVE